MSKARTVSMVRRPWVRCERGFLPLGWARFVRLPAAEFANKLCDGTVHPFCAPFRPLADSLRLRVASDALKGDRLRWLAELCGRHRGACPITVDYSGNDAKAQLQFGEGWRIEPADSLIQALRDQFGRDNVFLHYR